MRRIMVSLIAFGFVQSALAADYGEPVLRGSQTYYVPGNPVYFRWDGFYFGGQVGWTVSNIKISSVAPDTQIGGSANGASYGAYAGYNAQWENAVLGVEVNYNHTSVGSAPQPGLGSLGTTSASITDFGTFRGRGGWVFDNVMPYGFVGFAIGNADTTTLTGPSSAIGYGWALGAGVDWAVLPNIVLRAEYEYLRLDNMRDIRTTLNTVRTGVAVRF
jgi:opacity protein-like surface antigen